MTTTEPDPVKLTDDARALADAQPIIEVDEVAPDGPEPGVEIERATRPVHQHGAEERTAIEAAADAALSMPGVPGRDEFLALAMTARILAMSAGAPKAIQNNPHLAFHVAMIGRDLGISPSASIELIDVIERKKNGQHDGYQLSLSPQLLNGQLRRLGLGSIVPAVRTPVLCEAIPVGPRGLDRRCTRTGALSHVDDCACDILGPPSVFTWDDAQMAGLAGPDCQPGEHSAACKAFTRGSTCNQGYKAYPQRMMWWRAAGFCADDYFPEAGLGLYRPEELGAVVDEDGRPIDPASVELPPGYEPEEKGPSAADKAREPAPQIDRDAIKAKIEQLPPPARTALAALWSEPTGEQTDDGKPIPRIWPLNYLPNGQVKTAHALVDSVMKRAEKGEWGEWVGHDTDGTAAPAPEGQEPADGEARPDGPSDAPEAQETAQSEADPETDEDERCTNETCEDLAVVFDDDENPWCQRHAPAELFPEGGS